MCKDDREALTRGYWLGPGLHRDDALYWGLVFGLGKVIDLVDDVE